MFILFASRYVDPFAPGANQLVYLQAKGLNRIKNLSVKILTWPNGDLWGGARLSESQNPNFYLNEKRSEVEYIVINPPKKFEIPWNGDVLSEENWALAVQYGVSLLQAINPSILHMHHRHGFWWLLEAAQKIGLPTIYTNYDWGLACLRTTLVQENKKICNGKLGEKKCITCITNSRSSLLGKINEQIVKFKVIRSLLILTEKIPNLNSFLKSKGFVSSQINNRYRIQKSRAMTVLQNLNALITPSNFGKKFFCGLGCNRKIVNVIPWFFDPKKVHAKNQKGKPTILFLGRNSPEKGVHLIFESLEQNIIKTPVTIRIAGINNSKYCKNLMMKYPKRVGIHFVEWRPWGPIKDLLKGSEAIIIPSLWMENTPHVLIIAIAQKIPVILTKVASMNEFICEGKTGFFATYNSAKSLSAAINRFLKSRSKLPRYKNHFPKILTRSMYCNQLNKIYRKIKPQNEKN